MLVDPGISAAAATTFIADVKTLTPKPVKYVVDTHYHYDHAFGNQVFGPDVTIIGHDTTRRRLNGPGSLKERTYLTNSTAAIANRFTLLKRQISEAKDATGARDLRAAARHSSAIRRRAAQAEADAAQRDAVAGHDAASREPRNSDSIPGPRPHRRRHRRVPAARTHDCDRRHDYERAVIHRRRICRGVAGDARSGHGAGFRHGAARPRQRVQRQGPHPQPAGLLARFLSTGRRRFENRACRQRKRRRKST